MLTSDSSGSDLTKSMKIKTKEITTRPKDQSKRISKSLSMMNISRNHQSSPNNYMGNQDQSQEYYCYHGGSSVSVPFVWESQPGTPKVVKLRETSRLPPLTPPPSYWNSPAINRPITDRLQTNRKSNRQSFVKALFPKKKPLPPSLNSPSLSSSTSSRSSSYNYCYSPPSTPSRLGDPRLTASNPEMSVESRVDQEDEDHGSPVLTLCFGRISVNSRIGSGCYSSFIKVLLN